MRYSTRFESDFSWYLKSRHVFSFDGKLSHDVVYDKNGVSGKHAFYKWDSEGKMFPTRHPNILKSLLATKGSANLHIKMYAEDRAKGVMPMTVFDDLKKELSLPDWFVNAVEKQKYKYYQHEDN